MGKYQEVRLAKSEEEELVLNYSKDITYSINGQDQQVLQIIYPNKTLRASERVYPGVIYQLMDNTDVVSIYDLVPQLAKFAQRGYVIILVKNCKEANYSTVISYLQENASNFNLSTEYLFVLRDVNNEAFVSIETMKEVVTRQEVILGYIKGIISVGNKENFKDLCEDTNLKVPPVLCLYTAEDTSYPYGWWTEENFDTIEDFMSNYI
jgi:hypothetical protein